MGDMLPFPPAGEVSDDWQETHSTLAPYNDKTQTVTTSNPGFMLFSTLCKSEWKKNGGNQDICTDITRDKEKEKDNLWLAQVKKKTLILWQISKATKEETLKQTVSLPQI